MLQGLMSLNKGFGVVPRADLFVKRIVPNKSSLDTHSRMALMTKGAIEKIDAGKYVEYFGLANALQDCMDKDVSSIESGLGIIEDKFDSNNITPTKYEEYESLLNVFRDIANEFDCGAEKVEALFDKLSELSLAVSKETKQHQKSYYNDSRVSYNSGYSGVNGSYSGRGSSSSTGGGNYSGRTSHTDGGRTGRGTRYIK